MSAKKTKTEPAPTQIAATPTDPRRFLFAPQTNITLLELVEVLRPLGIVFNGLSFDALPQDAKRHFLRLEDAVQV